MTEEAVLALLLVFAGLGSAAVIGLALAALVRRQSWSYLLVTLALVTLAVRTGVAVFTMWGWLSMGTHHLLEHGLDVAMAGLVIAAVVTARDARESAGVNDDD